MSSSKLYRIAYIVITIHNVARILKTKPCTDASYRNDKYNEYKLKFTLPTTYTWDSPIFVVCSKHDGYLGFTFHFETLFLASLSTQT